MELQDCKWAEELDLNLGSFFDSRDERSSNPSNSSSSNAAEVSHDQASDESHDAIVERCNRVRDALENIMHLFKAHCPQNLCIGESRYTDNPRKNQDLQVGLIMELSVSNRSSSTAGLSVAKVLNTFHYVLLLQYSPLDINPASLELSEHSNSLSFSFIDGSFVNLRPIAGRRVNFQM